MFPSFLNNDLLSYSAHEFAFRMNPINCIDIMASDQFSNIVLCPLYFVFSPGVFSLFRHIAWSSFVILSFCLAFFRYFVFSRGVFSLFRLFAWRFFVISSFRLAFFRYFVFSRCVFSSFCLFAWRSGGAKRLDNALRKDKITKNATQYNEITK